MPKSVSGPTEFIVNLRLNDEFSADLSESRRSQDLFSADGNYLTTIYQQTFELNFVDAAMECQFLGMKLYEASSNEKKRALLRHASSVWPSQIGAVLWVDGSTKSKCTKLDQSNGQFHILDSTDCSIRMTSFCEKSESA